MVTIPHPVWHWLQTVAVGQTVTVVGWTAIRAQPHSNVTAASDTGKRVRQPAVLHKGRPRRLVAQGSEVGVVHTVSKAQAGRCARGRTARCRRYRRCRPERAGLGECGRDLDFYGGQGSLRLSSSNLYGICCHQCAALVSNHSHESASNILGLPRLTKIAKRQRP